MPTSYTSCPLCGFRSRAETTPPKCPNCKALWVPLADLGDYSLEDDSVGFSCPACHESYGVSPDLAGEAIWCRGCGELCRVSSPRRTRQRAARFRCAKCQAVYDMPEGFDGKVVRCRLCGEFSGGTDPRQRRAADPRQRRAADPRPPMATWLGSDDFWEAAKYVCCGVLVLLGLVGFILHVMAPGPTPEQRERERVQREARDRIDRQNNRLLEAVREAQIRDEMERQRRGGR